MYDGGVGGKKANLAAIEEVTPPMFGGIIVRFWIHKVDPLCGVFSARKKGERERQSAVVVELVARGLEEERGIVFITFSIFFSVL